MQINRERVAQIELAKWYRNLTVFQTLVMAWYYMYWWISKSHIFCYSCVTFKVGQAITVSPTLITKKGKNIELGSLILIDILPFCIMWLWINSASIRWSTFKAFSRTLNCLHRTKSNGHLSLFWYVGRHGLHLHSLIAKVTKQKCSNVFILNLFTNILLKSLSICWLSKFYR